MTGWEDDPTAILFRLLADARRSPHAAASRPKGEGAMEPSITPGARLARSFWLRLAQSASLLDEARRPTLLVEEWLGWPKAMRMQHLLETWLNRSGNQKIQRRRLDLVRRLQNRVPLSADQSRDLLALQALGGCRGMRLTRGGEALLKPKTDWRGRVPRVNPWIIAGESLIVPFPPDWPLVWQLEFWLHTAGPGVYGLDEPSLRLAVQRGAISGKAMVDVLARGLQAPPPPELLQKLEAAPTIRIIPGPVLEFSSLEELSGLRAARRGRKDFERLLSPRHVALAPERASRILEQLRRSGMIAEGDQQNSLTGGDQTNSLSLSKAERADLLCLALLGEFQTEIVPSPELLQKLSAGLDDSLRMAAARQASRAAAQIKAQRVEQAEKIAEGAIPLPPAEDVLEALRDAIARETAVDVFYQAAGKPAVAYRRISPLLLERRGGRWYLIAYCHMRRANRTFRIDRIRLLDLPPDAS